MKQGWAQRKEHTFWEHLCTYKDGCEVYFA